MGDPSCRYAGTFELWSLGAHAAVHHCIRDVGMAFLIQAINNTWSGLSLSGVGVHDGSNVAYACGVLRYRSRCGFNAVGEEFW